jgi:hypothetical protein
MSYLSVSTSTWHRDTHGLFDYDEKRLVKKSFSIASSCSIYRLNNDCYVLDTEVFSGSNGLVHIEAKPSSFQISLIQEASVSKMWLVIREIRTKRPKGYRLSEGDWLKLGRVKFRVQKIVLQPPAAANNSMVEFFFNPQGDREQELCEEENHEDVMAACRICLIEGGTAGDPLISPCNCAGTVKYIHLECLKRWIKSKMAAKFSEKSMSFHTKDFSCELCKCDFPASVMHKGQCISLLNVSFPNRSYIIFEEYLPEYSERIGMHMISLDETQSASIGRGNNCDVKISDISVSRKHCKIRLNENEFYIEDSNSKFGTLARLKKSFTMRANYDVTVQVNRTVFRFLYREPWTCKDVFKCCKGGKVFNANLSYLTQPEMQDSELEIASHFWSPEPRNPDEDEIN